MGLIRRGSKTGGVTIRQYITSSCGFGSVPQGNQREKDRGKERFSRNGTSLPHFHFPPTAILPASPQDGNSGQIHWGENSGRANRENGSTLDFGNALLLLPVLRDHISKRQSLWGNKGGPYRIMHSFSLFLRERKLVENPSPSAKSNDPTPRYLSGSRKLSGSGRGSYPSIIFLLRCFRGEENIQFQYEICLFAGESSVEREERINCKA